MWSILVLVLFNVLSNGFAKQILLGGRQPLSNEEFDSEQFRSILQEANTECNKRSNDVFWHKMVAVLDATKQVVQGINYEFKLRQRPTECKKSQVLTRGSNPVSPHEVSCAPHLKPVTQICSVSVLHRPWLKRKTEVTLHDIWRVHTNDVGFGEVHTKVKPDEPKWLKLRDDIVEAILLYNLHNSTGNIYTLAENQFLIRKDKLDGSIVLSVDLDETQCAKTNSVASIISAQVEPCYAEKTGRSLNCEIPLNDSNSEQPMVRTCKAIGKMTRGMWRSASLSDKAVSNCNLTKKITEERLANMSKLQNVVKLNVRSLSLDERYESKFQAAIDLAVMEYNKRLSAANTTPVMHKYFDVKQAKLQMTPRTVYEFTLILQPTTCSKNPIYLKDQASFEKNCPLAPTGHFQKCQFTVPLDGTREERRQLVTIAECQSTPRRPSRLVGASSYVSTDKRDKDPFKTLLDRIANQYTAQSNSSYRYKSVKAENVKQQVVAGMSYTMQVTMKAVGFKDQPTTPKAGEFNETTDHCQVKVWQQPWKQFESINISNCWRSVLVAKRIEGQLLPLGAEQESSLNLDLDSKLPMITDLNTTDLVFDHLENRRTLKVDEDKVYFFHLYLKNRREKNQTFQCTLMVIQGRFDPSKVKTHTFGCRPERATFGIDQVMLVLDEATIQSSEFIQKMNRVAEYYNQKQSSKTYHRYFGVKNATEKINSNTELNAFVYLQNTTCQAGKHGVFYRNGEHMLCGPANFTSLILCEVSIKSAQSGKSEQITIGQCLPVEPSSVPSIKPVRYQVYHTSTYDEIIDQILFVFNLHWNEPVLYGVHQIDTVDTEVVDEENFCRFDIYLRPTGCAKWGEMSFFGNGFHHLCRNSSEPQQLIKCKSTIRHSFQSSTIKLENCVRIEAGANHLPRPMTSKEVADPDFQNLVDTAVKLLNAHTYSTRWLELVNIENPMIGYLGGRYHTFDVQLVSSKCRTSMMNNSEACNHENSKFMLSCSVQSWKRGWGDYHKNLDLTSCHVIPMSIREKKASTTETPADHKACVEHLLPKFLETFRRQNNVTDVLIEPVFDNIKEDTLPGKRLTFDLYFKPSTKNAACSSSNKACADNYFYMCKASFWVRPWVNVEDYDLSNCMKVEIPSKTMTAADLSNSLELFKLKAVHLYNEKLAKNYVYGPAEVNNPKFMTDFGLKISFELVMEPRACLLHSDRKTCNADQSKLRVQCYVIAKRQPWLPESESIVLKNCLETYARDWADEKGQLSEEEQNSDEFKQALNKLVNLYRPPLPLLYSLKKVQGSAIQSDNDWRNITLELALQPVGCNVSQPDARSDRCVDYSKQDEVLCQALIAENRQSMGLKLLFLKHCQQLWQPSAKRPMTDQEKTSSWFKESLNHAWKIQTGIPVEPNLYTLVDIRDANIEIMENRIVTYKMDLVETECKQKQDEAKFSDGSSAECSIPDDPKAKSCRIVYTQQPDGRYFTQVACSIEKYDTSKNVVAVDETLFDE